MVLVTGAEGQLGHDIVKQLKKSNREVVGIDIRELDLTEESKVVTYLDSVKPKIIIHCAAWTAVDLAETEQLKCYDVNVNATKYLANYCHINDIELIFFSTDYVFKGNICNNICYKENNIPDPINYYGSTKLLGEKEVMKVKKHRIFRISWVFGSNGNNFVSKMLKLAKEKTELSVVSDQVGSPTYTVDLAVFLDDTLNETVYGVFNVTNEGYCTWYEYAQEIMRISNSKTKIFPTSSAKFETKARRPKNSKLCKNKIKESFSYELPSWEDALRRYIVEIGEDL